MFRNRTILIVNDDQDIDTLQSRVLVENGYRCLQASSSKDALTTLKSESIDLCLLDINFPGKSGKSLLRTIKVCYPEVTVVIATEISDFAMAIHCRDLGAEDYLLRPFEPEQLLISVYNALDRKRLLQENTFYRTGLEKKLREQEAKLRALQVANSAGVQPLCLL